MSVSANYFAPLPNVLLANIFEFANDGPKKLAFDAKKEAFVEKINKNVEGIYYLYTYDIIFIITIYIKVMIIYIF